MLTHGKRKWLVVCFAIVLATLAVTSYFIPIQYDVCAKSEYPGQKKCSTYHIAPFVVLYIGEFLEAHNGAVTAIATCFIALFTLILWRATSQQSQITNAALQLARDEFNATHRPKLRVRLIRLDHIEGSQIRIHYTVVNIGETRAILKRHEVTLCVQAANIQQGALVQCPELMAGGSAIFWVPIKFDYDLGWKFAVNGEIKIRGRIEYDDAAGVTRRIGFFRAYDHKRGHFRNTSDTEEEYED